MFGTAEAIKADYAVLRRKLKARKSKWRPCEYCGSKWPAILVGYEPDTLSEAPAKHCGQCRAPR